MISGLREDAGDAAMDRLDNRARKQIYSDTKTYLGTLAYFGAFLSRILRVSLVLTPRNPGVVNTGYAGSFFIPTIIRELGCTFSMAQVRSIPIFIVASITAIMTAYMSDRRQHRYWFCMSGLVVASIGYIMLLAQDNLSVAIKYFSLFLIVPGGFIT
jgi:uncharacterized membrane protein HdeD (DUF308 family)